MMDFDLNDELQPHVRAVQSGERSSFRAIVERMLPVLRAYVAARTLPGMEVDDIVQRTFIEAYKSIGQYRLGTDFRAWLITIARYQSMMEATRLRRQADYHSRFIPVAVARMAERRLMDEEGEDGRLPYLRECLAKIKRSARELIRHRYEEDLSMKEIAGKLNRTAGAVRKELCLIRQQLHACVERKLAAEESAVGGGD